MGIGIFRWYYQIPGGRSGIYDNLAAQAVMIGVWGRAALLAGLFVAFLAARATIDDDPEPTADRPVEPAHAGP
jgi:hypothetical protein